VTTQESAYDAKIARLADRLRASGAGAAGVGLGKNTSNLFRDRVRRRDAPAVPGVDLSGFSDVLRVSVAHACVEAEGMTPYSALVDATLAQYTMPCVVPQLKSITLGGAAAGVGVEASSFKYGLAHETLISIDVLLADGSIAHCTRDNEHRDLFYGFPNSYGTLGYALKLTARTIPVKQYVALQHVRHRSSRQYFEELDLRCKEGSADFIDGVVFSPDEMYISIGRFTDSAPYLSDYSFQNIYYRSIREKPRDYLTTRDFLWRWDTDWFWCSRNLGAQNPLIRTLMGKHRLNSVTYQRVMRWNSKWGLMRRLNRLMGRHTESVIQDVDIPIGRAGEFLEFLLREIGILPVWICPVRVHDMSDEYPLYRMRPGITCVNFGFWDVVKDRQRRAPGYYNRMVERKVIELGGIKSLYSDSYFSEDEFWRIYNKPAYDALKQRYDPNNRFKNLYEKCVLRQ
jgi:FAD/FMN-containing dehydrogenase